VIKSKEYARQTLIQLSKLKLAPTPENYQQVYYEISGEDNSSRPEILNNAFTKVLSNLSKDSTYYSSFNDLVLNSLKNKETKTLETHIEKLITTKTDETQEFWLQKFIKKLVKQIEKTHVDITLDEKISQIDRLCSIQIENNSVFQKRLINFITSWDDIGQIKNGIIFDNFHPEIPADRKNKLLEIEIWREMLIQALKFSVSPQIVDNQDASNRLNSIVEKTYGAKTLEDIFDLKIALSKALIRSEMYADKQNHIYEALIKVIKLLLLNLRDIPSKDTWLQSQIDIVDDVISKPLCLENILTAEFVLNDILTKQSKITPVLLEAKSALNDMMSTFVKELDDVTQNTENYNNKISKHKEKIAISDDINQLSEILTSLSLDINIMGVTAKSSFEAFSESQTKVRDAENKINELTTKLEAINKEAHQDFLTGALNRRGMDEVIKLEFRRSEKHNTNLSLAMIDVDHFKKINDKLGHVVGDSTIAHLATVVRNVLRKTDVLARYGGEEFLILLPGSNQEDAIRVINGVQRALTKNFFLHNSEKVLITFSAGVAEKKWGESVEELISRADVALYSAKNTGRNRVVGAD